MLLLGFKFLSFLNILGFVWKIRRWPIFNVDTKILRRSQKIYSWERELAKCLVFEWLLEVRIRVPQSPVVNFKKINKFGHRYWTRNYRGYVREYKERRQCSLIVVHYANNFMYLFNYRFINKVIWFHIKCFPTKNTS